jgi:putative transcriptional regulator
MTPTHHLPTDLLLERSAGLLPEALDVFVATHLTLCPACREREAALDGLGGALLAQEAAAPVPDALRDAVLARIADSPQAEPAIPASDPVFPRPLLRYVGPAGALRWGSALLGCRRLDLPLTHGGRNVRLLRFPAGMRIPAHAHTDVEYSLVLAGGYTDGADHHARGDVAVHAPGDTHSPRIDRDGPCTLLLVHAGRLVPQSLWGRLGTWFVDH